MNDATPLTGGLAVFAKLPGTVGGAITIVPLDPKTPNSVGTGQVFSALDPANVAHTFTVAGLGINIPVAPKARTIFSIETGAPGTYAWRRNDPCGSGAAGWGGASRPVMSPAWSAALPGLALRCMCGIEQAIPLHPFRQPEEPHRAGAVFVLP